MITIESTHSYGASALRRRCPAASHAAVALTVLTLMVLSFLSLCTPAFAGNASTGELAFEPCADCHPVVLGSDGKPTRPLPNGFEKHEIELEVHDILGKGDAACLACHDDPAKNPGMLLTADGTKVYVTGDTPRVCQRCHFAQYQQWQLGVHGRNEVKCTSAGCHDPHTPSWIYIPALPPFQGTGVEVRAVGEREAFKPMASPPVAPPVYTPLWLAIMTSLGVVVAGGTIGYLIFGRRAR